MLQKMPLLPPNRSFNRDSPGFHNRPSARFFGPSTTSAPRLQCQVCHKIGHTDAVCHYRFAKTFVPPKLGKAKAFLAEVDDKDAPQAYSSMTIPDFGEDSDWYADTSASNHIAQEHEPLESEISYSGFEALVVSHHSCW